MKNNRLIVLLLSVIIASQAHADIIDMNYDFGANLSLKATAGVEQAFTGFNTAAVWGGIGSVYMVDKMDRPARKGEFVFEIKHYFLKNKYSGFNVGLFSGLEYLHKKGYIIYDQEIRDESSVGFVPGLKLSYTGNLNSWLQLEPYLGVSTPWYSYDMRNLLKGMSRGDDPGFLVTIGVRAGFNKLLVK